MGAKTWQLINKLLEDVGKSGKKLIIEVKRFHLSTDSRRRACRGRRARVRPRVQRPVVRSGAGLRGVRVRRARRRAGGSVGAVPGPRLLVLRESQRAGRRPPHRRAGCGAPRGDGRQGRQPLAERRAERRRNRARVAVPSVARLGRVDPSARRRPSRFDAVRRAGQRSALVHACRWARARVRLGVGGGAALRGSRERRRGRRAPRARVRWNRARVPGGCGRAGGRRAWR